MEACLLGSMEYVLGVSGEYVQYVEEVECIGYVVGVKMGNLRIYLWRAGH